MLKRNKGDWFIDAIWLIVRVYSGLAIVTYILAVMAAQWLTY